MIHPDTRQSSPAKGETARLIRQYDRPGPRYTSYPTAVEFSDAFDEASYRERLSAAARTDASLSLYVHLPFCAARCTYCGCMTVITRRSDVVSRYLEYLESETALLAQHLGPRRHIAQLHWGGGTPTYLDGAQLARLHSTIRRHFDIDAGAEQAIEVDPRVTSREQLQLLRSLGFNRLSMGIQDLDVDVQAAIGRRQSEEMTRHVYEYARQLDFSSINFDLVYGLPRQTLTTFSRTLASVAEMQPDRVAVYSYAHVPWLRPHQRRIETSDLPDAALKFALIGEAVETLGSAGYTAIGMDHFARPGDDLARAARDRRLHRNFMGYTTQPASDLLGLGLSAIGDVQGAFAQNVKKLTGYYAALDAGRFPIERGRALDADDLVRRHVITQLMCNLRIDRASVAERFGLDFDSYFGAELETLRALDGALAHGLLTDTPGALEVTSRGRLFVRTICMTFDRYLPAHHGTPVFSRTI